MSQDLGIPVHPVADMFPLIEPEAFRELVENIRTHGQLVPCVLHKGTLLDGRNRWLACREIGIEPKTIEWVPTEQATATEFILALNIERRHLTDDQRVTIEARALPHLDAERAERKKATQFKAGNEASSLGGLAKAGKLPPRLNSDEPAKRDAKKENANSTAGRLAASAKVSRHKATQAIKVIKQAPPGVVRDVEAGKITLKDAVKMVEADKPKMPASSWDLDTEAARVEKLMLPFRDRCPSTHLSAMRNIFIKYAEEIFQ